jgi:hypothetical protein
MGWRYVLINHTRKIIVETSLNSIWGDMSHLIREQGWETSDDVEMMFEDGHMEEIGELVVNEGYKSPYGPMSFVYN